MIMSHQTEFLELTDTLELEVETRKIVVYNDDVNTFDHVIDTFINVLGHSPEQAEQCAVIIHFKGKCIVKEGELNELVPLKDAICNQGIDARIG